MALSPFHLRDSQEGRHYALLVAVLFIPQLEYLQGALQHNFGESAERGSQNITALSIWHREIFYAFGANSRPLAYAMDGLFILACGHWVKERNWKHLTHITGGSVLPAILIVLFRVSRWAFPKYVIYLLPFYLLAAGGGL